MDSTSPAHEIKVGPFQIIILSLSAFVLLALFVDTLLKLPAEVSRILQGLDLFICGILFIDFLARFYQAECKREFIKWGWVDLVACVPNIDILRVGRLVRVLRVIRLLRGVRSFHRLLQVMFRHKRRGGFASVILATFFLVVFSSVAILVCEQVPESNINSAEDAVWWSFTTITTVGYGDKYPITSEGRTIAIFAMLSGVGLFGTMSGLVASFFLGAKQDEENAELKQILVRLDALDAKFGSLRSDNKTD